MTGEFIAAVCGCVIGIIIGTAATIDRPTKPKKGRHKP